MRYTLLELTKSILRSMESDEVGSIIDTQEAQDVVDIIKECYFDIIGQQNLSEHEGIFKLIPSGDNTKPTLMTLPSNVTRIDWMSYNVDFSDDNWSRLRYTSNEEFFFYQSGIDSDDPDVGTMDVSINSGVFKFKFWKDRNPSYFTVFDRDILIFDGYDSSVDSTLQSVKTVAHGLVVPEFIAEDSFIPDLAPAQFQLLLQDAKSTAHVELKQAQNPKAEAKYRRNIILAQKTRNDTMRSDTSQKRINYGRK
jgi:hypothetical protein